MLTIQEQLEKAKMAGIQNWIDPNQSVKGWYTCLLTGKKFRGQAVADQIALQDDLVDQWTSEINAMKDSMDAEAEIKSEIESTETESTEVEEEEEEEFDGEEEEEEETKSPKVVRRMVEVVGGFHTEVHLTPTLDIHKATTDAKKIKTTIINCIDCGTPREIKVQDVFQVKRCPHCQAEHRKAVRRANYKARKEAERQAKEAEEKAPLSTMAQELDRMIDEEMKKVKKENELKELAKQVGLASDQEESKPVLSAQQQIEMLAQQGKLFE